MNHLPAISTGFALIPAALAGDAPAPAFGESVYLGSLPVAGLPYHDVDRLPEPLADGDPLELVREPANPYDRFAVAVRAQGRRIGYLPRSGNRVFARLIDAGKALTGQAVRPATAGAGDAWMTLRVRISMQNI